MQKKYQKNPNIFLNDKFLSQNNETFSKNCILLYKKIAIQGFNK